MKWTDEDIANALAEFERANRELDAAWVELDKLWSDKTANNLRKGVTIEEYQKQLGRIEEHGKRAMGWLDRWRYLIKHQNDPRDVPAIPEEEVRAVINASLSDKMDEVDFSLNYGLLAKHVAHSIRMDVEEGDAGGVPLCADCNA